MVSGGMQILGFVLALLGTLGATVATLLPNWKVSADVGSNIITAISQMQGLWMDCTWYSTGMFSCTLKYSVLLLPAYLQTARTSMVLSCVLATLGLCLAALGLKCTRWGGSRRAKGHAALASGTCFTLAGVLCLVPASWFTNEVITSFLDANVPESSKFEPGGAIYAAFVSAGFLLTGGVIFCISCPGKSERPQDFTASPPDKPLPQPPLVHSQLPQPPLVQSQHHQQPLVQSQHHQQPLVQSQHHQQPLVQSQHHQQPLVQSQHHQQPLVQGHHLQHQMVQEQLHHSEAQHYAPAPAHPEDSRAGYILQDYV